MLSESRPTVQTNAEEATSALEAEADRIISAATDAGLVVKLSGSLAIRKRCYSRRLLQLRGNRIVSDVDLIALFQNKQDVEEMMEALGYVSDAAIGTVPGIRRSLFYSSDRHCRCDIFYDALEFCHTIDLRGRLEVDHPTIPLVELLLQKLQIVDLTYKDIVDVQLLLMEYDLAPSDEGVINVVRFSSLCSRNWGLWFTVRQNLLKIRQLTTDDSELSREERHLIAVRVNRLLDRLEHDRKSFWWKLRAIIGTKLRWYNVVEDISYSFA